MEDKGSASSKEAGITTDRTVVFRRTAAIVLSIVVSSTILYYVYYDLAARTKADLKYSKALLEAITASELRKDTRTQQLLEKKKLELANVSAVAFHYANEEQIKAFYNDYFKEPTIEQVISEASREITGDVKGDLPKILEAKAGAKDLTKWIRTIKLPDISVNEMFRRYQKQTIENQQVTLGIEVLDLDLQDLERFDQLIKELDSKFGFPLGGEEVEQRRVFLKAKAAEKTLLRLEGVTGWILIEGKFTIEDFSTDFYKLVYFHPVNEYLTGLPDKVIITAVVKKSAISDQYSGNYAQSIGQTIPLRIYGNVWQPLSRSTKNWDVKVTPMAIY